MKGSDGRYWVELFRAGNDKIIDLGTSKPATGKMVRQLKAEFNAQVDWQFRFFLWSASLRWCVPNKCKRHVSTVDS